MQSVGWYRERVEWGVMAQERNRKKFRVASAQSLTGNGGRRVGVASRGGLGRHLVR